MFRSARTWTLPLIAALSLLPSTALARGSANQPAPLSLSQPDGAVKAAAQHAQGTSALTVTPEEIVVALPLGQAATQTLRVVNKGPDELHLTLDARGVTGQAPASAIAAPYRLLVLTPSSGATLDPLRSVLDGLDDVAYTVWNPAAGAPTGGDLAGYDVVLVGNGSQWEPGIDPAALSQALADYVDQGGKVIDTLLVTHAGGYGLAGPYVERGHAPLLPTDRVRIAPLHVAVVDPLHPLMAGLASMATGQALETAARPGAAVPAVYAGTDWPYVAATADVVAINQQLCYGGWGTGDLGALLRAAIVWLCGERWPWLRVEPAAARLAPGEALDATVYIDLSATVAPAVYRGEIALLGNGPATPVELAVPVEAAALVDLSMGRLSGMVSSDHPGGPLAGVEVSVIQAGSRPHATGTDAQGAYSLWLTPGDYALTFGTPGYASHETALHMPPQGRVLIDVELVCTSPRLRLSPQRVVIATPGAHSIEAAIANDGGGVLTFALDSANLPWLTLEPASGAVAAGESASLLLRLDTALARPGWNVARLALTSNDPRQSPDALRIYLKAGQAVMLPLTLSSP